MAYLLDANVFIEASNNFYGFDLCPGFWEWLRLENEAGIVFSIESIRDELLVRDDRLSAWVREQEARFFLPSDPTLLEAFPVLTSWLNKPRYRPLAVRDFMQQADYTLVAHALVHGHTVVTHEVPSEAVKRVKNS